MNRYYAVTSEIDQEIGQLTARIEVLNMRRRRSGAGPADNGRDDRWPTSPPVQAMTPADHQTLMQALQSENFEDRIIAALGALAWVIAEIPAEPERELLLRNCADSLPDAVEHARRCQHQITYERVCRLDSRAAESSEP